VDDPSFKGRDRQVVAIYRLPIGPIIFAMKVLALIFGLCVINLAFGEEGEIVKLTDDNFDKVTKTGVVMVKFFVPWCPHCKSLAPEFEKLATKAKEQKKGFTLAEMDGSVGYKAPGNHKVAGYPALRLFMNGIEMDYRGPRTVEAMMTYIDGKIKFQVPRLKTPAEVQAVVNDTGRRVSLLHNPSVHHGQQSTKRPQRLHSNRLGTRTIQILCSEQQCHQGTVGRCRTPAVHRCAEGL
jgi:protein disulfide-isomerase-like protein